MLVDVGVEGTGSGSPFQTSMTVRMTAARMMTTIKRPQARERIVFDNLPVPV
jgi:hypothetical protein